MIDGKASNFHREEAVQKRDDDTGPEERGNVQPSGRSAGGDNDKKGY